MTPADLESAYWRAGSERPMRQSELDKFFAAGVPPLALVSPDMWLPARVAFDAPGRFCFQDELRDPGELTGAFILPARDEGGDIIDLVAWRPADSTLATWRGTAWAIGEDWLAEPYYVLRDDGALAVFREPMAWLRASRNGVVVLDHARAVWALRDRKPLLAEDFAHAAALAKALAFVPQILLPEIEDRIAA